MVLVVEDDAALRTLVVRVLERQGYTVRQAADAQALRRHLAQYSLDVVLLDLVLEGESGVRLAEEIEGASPGSRVLFMSGHAREHLPPEHTPPAGSVLLKKPFAPSALTRAVKEILEEGA